MRDNKAKSLTSEGKKVRGCVDEVLAQVGWEKNGCASRLWGPQEEE